MNEAKKLSGISLDTALGSFRMMLRFKAERAGATYVQVSEKDATGAPSLNRALLADGNIQKKAGLGLG